MQKLHGQNYKRSWIPRQYNDRMIKRILLVLLVFMVVALVALWLISGGVSSITNTAKNLVNPVNFFTGSDTSGSSIRLPWQIDAPRGPDISSLASGYSDDPDGQTPEEYATAYQELNARAIELQTFGDPSPYAGTVSLRGSAVRERDAAREYVELSASGTMAINITGWSLQSAVSGLRVFLPPAASPFMLGTLNPVESVYLKPKETALIVSGPSPVGISFKENMCSGYLNEQQTFTPELSAACPAPSDLLVETPDSLRIYGTACFDYIDTIPQCRFPGTTYPSNVSAPCRTLLVNTLSYNGCVQANRYHPSFDRGEWRIFLNSRTELWDNSRDIIRLMDAQGRTVDIYSY